MMRCILTIGLVLACTAGSGPARAQTVPKPLVAVLPFTGEGVGPASPQLATQFLQSTLRDAREVTLADAGTVLTALQNAAPGGKCSDNDCALRVGRAAAAAKVVVGTLVKDGSGTRLSLRGLDVASGQQVYAETRPLANENAALAAIATMAPLLSAALTRPTGPAPPAQVSPPPVTVAAPPATTLPPSLTIEHNPITNAEAGRALLVSARVRPQLGNSMLFVMHRNLGEPSFKLVRMSGRGDERYEGEIPPPLAGTTLEYCLRALDATGQQAARFPAGLENLRVSISGAMTQPPATPQVAASPTSPPSSPSSPPPSAKKGGGKKKWYWIGAGVVAAGAGVYLASQGGGDETAPPPVLTQLPIPPTRP